MAENKVRIEDHTGNIYYPHTIADVVFMNDGLTMEAILAQIIGTGISKINVVPNGTDLNNLKTQGFYFFGSGVLVNAPVNRAGVILVLGDAKYPTQLYFATYLNDIYVRSKTSTTQDTWTTWEKINNATDLNGHINNKSNPHGVTKTQVGLGNIENYGIATQAEAEAGVSSTKYMTPLRTQQMLDRLQKMSVYRNTANQIVVSGTASINLQFSTVVRVNEDTYTSIDSATGRIKAEVDGVYFYTLQGDFNHNPSGSRALIGNNNGAIKEPNSNATSLRLNVTALHYRQAGEFITASAWQDSGVSLMLSNVVMSIMKVG